MKIIHNILGEEIDFTKIERVGEIYGDQMWRRYPVYFTSGRVLEILQDRYYESYPREEFLKIWIKVKTEMALNSGKYLGSITSKAKKASSAENGKLGGRPKKSKKMPTKKS
jgi:hypothetical protein